MADEASLTPPTAHLRLCGRVPNRLWTGTGPRPGGWGPLVLTTGPPGKSLKLIFMIKVIYVCSIKDPISVRLVIESSISLSHSPSPWASCSKGNCFQLFQLFLVVTFIFLNEMLIWLYYEFSNLSIDFLLWKMKI